MKPFQVYSQLLKGGEVDYVSRTSIVYQDSSSVEPSYHEHNDQGVTIWLFYPSGVLLREDHVYSFSFLVFRRWHHVDVANLSFL